MRLYEGLPSWRAAFAAFEAQLLEAGDTLLHFFDRTGFSRRLRQVARERPDVHLVATADMP